MSKVELSQIRNLGEITDDSILFFKQNWKPLLKSYFTISGFFLVAGVIISVFNQTEMFRLQQQGESVYSLTFFLTILFYFVNFVFIVITVLSYMALYHEKGKNAPAVEEVWGYVKYFLLRVFSSSVLLIIMLGLGLLFCVFPGIYFAPIFLIIIAIMIFENASLRYSLSRGFQVLKGRWWQLTGVLVVMMMIVCSAAVLLSIPSAIVAGLLIFLTNVNHEHTESITLVITANSLQVLLLLPVISIGLTYFSLMEQQDDSSFIQRIKMLGLHSQDSGHLPSEEY